MQVFYLSALEMLGLSCRLWMFLMGKRISLIVMVFSLKSSTVIRSYKGSVPPWGYSTVSGHRCTLLLAEYSTKES